MTAPPTVPDLPAEYAAVLGDALTPVHQLLDAAKREGVNMPDLFARLIHHHGKYVSEHGDPRVFARAVFAAGGLLRRAAYTSAADNARTDAEAWMEPVAQALWPGCWSWDQWHENIAVRVDACVTTSDGSPALRTYLLELTRTYTIHVQCHRGRRVTLWRLNTPRTLARRYLDWLRNATPSHHEPHQLEALRALAQNASLAIARLSDRFAVADQSDQTE